MGDLKVGASQGLESRGGQVLEGREAPRFRAGLRGGWGSAAFPFCDHAHWLSIRWCFVGSKEPVLWLGPFYAAFCFC